MNNFILNLEYISHKLSIAFHFILMQIRFALEKWIQIEHFLLIVLIN